MTKKFFIKINEQVKTEHKPHCYHCGEDERIAYNDQYANGEEWTCKQCGESFFFTDQNPLQE